MNRVLIAIACIVAGCGPAMPKSQPTATDAAQTTITEPNFDSDVSSTPSSTDVESGESAPGQDAIARAQIHLGWMGRGQVPSSSPDCPPTETPFSRRRSHATPDDDAGSPFGGTVDTIISGGPGMIGAGMRVRKGPIPGHPGLYELTLNNTGSGWEEKFLLQVPNVQLPQLAPMLVAFHKFGNTQWDIQVNTTFLQECKDRGWYMVAPLGASRVSYGCLESQINTRAALDYVAERFNIDRTRVYAVGFSMGAGSALNYAARHLDPAGVMFAAVVNHTGGVSHTNTWALAFDDNDVDDDPLTGEFMEGPDWLEFWFGGPPSTHLFDFQRCSVIDLDPVTQVIGVDTDLSRNLTHVPVLSWMSNTDPQAYLRDQTTAFYGHVQSQNASNALVALPSGGHTWHTLDETQACDFLAQFQLVIPTSGSTLADEDGIYFHFQVEQDASGAFSPLTWSLVPGQYTFNLSATSNLKKVYVRSTEAGVNFLQPWTLNLSTSDATGDTVVLQNMPIAPSSVTRDGLSTPAFYDPVADTLEIVETDGNPHTWVLAFP